MEWDGDWSGIAGMPDYIYLLANRLSPSQQNALQLIRDAARDAGMTVFLTGGAVRDLTSGSPVRDLDVSVQGNALDLKPKLKEAGAVIWGEHGPSQTLFARFPGSVRVEVSSTRREEFPKPGKPVYHPGSILEDLRRRDFTANAMALSLNEGSYGLLMDPLNGVADLEARLLRLVSNYGFLEDPIRLVRAARLQARLGWELEEKTRTRMENAMAEGVISLISAYQQGYELEEIVHEEDGHRILKALEAEGWMKPLCPAWTSAAADIEGLEMMREVLVQLQMQGVNPDPSAAQAELLTAKLPAKDIAGLKKLFVRPGFVKEWESQDDRAKELARRLTGKEASTPSATWKLLTSTDPEAVLWLGLTGKSGPVQEKFKDFFTLWPESRSRIPYALMQEMRITPELPGYQDLVRSIFFELIDGRLSTDEEMRQFLEPHSPPAPPPPVTIRRSRAKKGARSVDVREIDDDESPQSQLGDDEAGEDAEDESEPADERSELIARSAGPIISDELLSPVPPPLPVVPSPATRTAPVPVPPAEFTPGKTEKPYSRPEAVPRPVAAIAEPKPKAAAARPVKEPAKDSATHGSATHPEKVSLAASPKAEATISSKRPSAQPPSAKAPMAKAPVKAKSTAKAPVTKPVAKTASATPAKSSKPALSKSVVRPAKPAFKKTGAARPVLKKAAVKKAAVKPAAAGKLRKVVAKPRPAKAIVKVTPPAGKARSPLQSKSATKLPHTMLKPVSAKKKR